MSWPGVGSLSNNNISLGSAGIRGMKTGSLDFMVAGAPIAVPLVLDGSISGPDGWWQLTHPHELLTVR